MSFLNRRKRRAAVLGCGPAGLFAAHGLVSNGWEVRIFSRPGKSSLYGCQYLHAPIPGLTDEVEPRQVKYELVGTVEDYREKVYGLTSPNQFLVSPQSIEADHWAWDIRSAYEIAWDRYSPLVSEVPHIGPQQIISLSVGFDAVISSIPAFNLCYGDHQFRSIDVFAIGDAPALGVSSPVRVAGDEHIICDATKERGWYRNANVFGHTTTEWPGRKRPPIPGLVKVSKPTGTDCTCFQRGGGSTIPVLRVGRFGTWNKSVLSHTAYTEAANL
jgi:hypothetical protein